LLVVIYTFIVTKKEDNQNRLSEMFGLYFKCFNQFFGIRKRPVLDRSFHEGKYDFLFNLIVIVKNYACQE